MYNPKKYFKSRSQGLPTCAVDSRLLWRKIGQIKTKMGQYLEKLGRKQEQRMEGVLEI